MVDEYYVLKTGYVPHLGEGCAFPPVETALKDPNGLLAIGGALETDRLISAYRQGIFPWYSADEPVMWWSPNPRMVLFPNELKISRSLKKVINKSTFDIRYNTAFRAVMQACGEAPRPDQAGTWITDEMLEAYCKLHTLGFAHSVEAWQNDQLVGGCYGIKINRMFYGESMFHHVSDASKVAFVHLVNHLQAQGVGLIDCQIKTNHLARFGAREIARSTFIKHLNHYVQEQD